MFLSSLPFDICFSCFLLNSIVHRKMFIPFIAKRPPSFSSFSYPSSYGENKHSIPTTRSTCNKPVFFSDYWRVLYEIQASCKNSTALSDRHPPYLQGKHQTFGGNFSNEKRFSYFDYSDKKVPCGFFKDFPVSDDDRIVMQRCEGVVVVSAIFGDHDKIRQPKGLGANTLSNVCYFMFLDDHTLKRLSRHSLISPDSKEKFIGVWRIVKVLSEHLYENKAMNGEIPKYLVHRLFPNSIYSIWIDAKIQLVIDPLLLIHSFLVSENVDMAISKHPFYIHTMEEAMATARWKKWSDVDSLKRQMETYCEKGLEPWSSNKLPYPSDVPDSALILRKHSLENNLFSCLVFNELEAYNPRDQLAFAFVRDHMKPSLKMNMFDVEVLEQVALEYRHNIRPGGGQSGSNANSSRTKRASFDLFEKKKMKGVVVRAIC